MDGTPPSCTEEMKGGHRPGSSASQAAFTSSCTEVPGADGREIAMAESWGYR